MFKILSKKLMLLIMFLICLSLLVSCGVQNMTMSETQNASSTQDITTVNVTGKVAIKDTYSIALNSSVKIKDIYVSEGDLVKKGNSILGLVLNDEEKELLLSELGKDLFQNGTIISNLNNGIISKINFDKGSIVPPEETIVSIQDYDTLYIKALVPEVLIKNINIGQTAKVTPYVDRTAPSLEGEVASISKIAQEIDEQTYVIVNITLKNKTEDKNKDTEMLLPNYNVDVIINADKK